jgi:hypothetical protein
MNLLRYTPTIVRRLPPVIILVGLAVGACINYIWALVEHPLFT